MIAIGMGMQKVPAFLHHKPWELMHGVVNSMLLALVLLAILGLRYPLKMLSGLSQVEMAHRFGIDRGHISEIETGKKNVCLPMLDVLAEGFGITISELMKGV